MIPAFADYSWFEASLETKDANFPAAQEYLKQKTAFYEEKVGRAEARIGT